MLKTTTSIINASQIAGVLPVLNGGTGVTTSTGTGSTVLSAAPTLSGNVTLSTGNLVIGTSGKGIDFSATPGTGTSELLNDYEEGTWTPTDASGAGLVFTDVAGNYTKIGNCVTAAFTVTYPATANANNARISLPFNSVAGNNNTGFFMTLTNSGLSSTGITNGSFLQFYDNALNNRNNVDFSGFIIRGVAVYYT